MYRQDPASWILQVSYIHGAAQLSVYTHTHTHVHTPSQSTMIMVSVDGGKSSFIAMRHVTALDSRLRNSIPTKQNKKTRKNRRKKTKALPPIMSASMHNDVKRILIEIVATLTSTATNCNDSVTVVSRWPYIHQPYVDHMHISHV